MISAILVSYNEADNPIFWQNVDLLRGQPDCELIVVDGGSQDGTWERFRSMGMYVFLQPLAHRARRYNYGMDQAHGYWLLLVHPRSKISLAHLEEIRALSPNSESWGAFTHSFDHTHPILNFTSWYSNRIRGQGRSIYYLDHCLFMARSLGGRFRDMQLFEDTYFSADLRGKVRGRLLKSKTVTSAIRFRKNGFVKQSLLNQVMKILFYLRVSESTLNRVYERGLSLNLKID